MMTVRAVEKGTGRVRTGRIGGGSGSGGVAPAFQTDFTALNALPAGVSLSRASNAMVYDSTGKLTYAPNNMLTHTDDLTTGWANNAMTVAAGISDPLGGNNAFTLTANAGSSFIYKQATYTGNNVASIWVRRRTGSGDIKLYNPNFAGSVVIAVTGTWQLLFNTGPDGGGTSTFLIMIDTSGDAIDVYNPVLAAVTYETTQRAADQVITTTAAYYGPRFDHAWNGSAWVAKGLLAEEQRTNQVLQSDNLPAAWSPEFLTFSTGGTSPSGTAAQQLIEGVGSSRWAWLQSVGLGSAIYTLSFYASDNGRRYVTASMGATTTRIAFDLVSGTITQNDPNASGTITSLGNGLYRCTLTSVSAVAIDYIVFGLSDTGTPAWESYGRAVYTAPGSGVGIYFDDVQPEAGAFATSYIPTTTAAVTRSADLLSSTAPLTAFLAAGPSVWEFQDEATGVIARTAYAAGAFDWPVNKWYRSMGVYPAGTDTSGHMVVGSGY